MKCAECDELDRQMAAARAQQSQATGARERDAADVCEYDLTSDGAGSGGLCARAAVAARSLVNRLRHGILGDKGV
jgi:hypothetical protein